MNKSGEDVKTAANHLGASFLAALEVTGVFVIGNLMAYVLGKMVNMSSSMESLNEEFSAAQPNFLKLAWIIGFNLVVQYIGLFIPVIIIGWLRKKRRLRDYGLTLASRKPGYLILAGVLGFCCGALILKLFILANKFIPMGAGSEFWAIFNVKWNLHFWLFMAVGSFLIVPVLEELFYRGYFQGRLTVSFGGTPAILMTSAFFVLNHSQYHNLSALSIGTMITLFIFSLTLGYLYHRTGSLIAPMIAHALINIPYKGFFDYLVPVLMICTVFLYRKKVASFFRQSNSKASLFMQKWILTLFILFFGLLGAFLSRLFNFL